MWFEIDLRDKHRLLRIGMSLLVPRVGDPVVATGHLLQSDGKHVEAVFGQSKAKEIIVAADAERTERVVAIHSEAQASNQHIQSEERAADQKSDRYHLGRQQHKPGPDFPSFSLPSEMLGI
jgi:hypothetical protein